MSIIIYTHYDKRRNVKGMIDLRSSIGAGHIEVSFLIFLIAECKNMARTYSNAKTKVASLQAEKNLRDPYLGNHEGFDILETHLTKRA